MQENSYLATFLRGFKYFFKIYHSTIVLFTPLSPKCLPYLRYYRYTDEYFELNSHSDACYMPL
jgi:hypothetical protein